MNTSNKTTENGNVPNNLPHENSSNDNIQLNIPKKRLKTALKVLIIVLILVVSAPRILTNVSSTIEIVGGEAEKFPQVFPSLTLTGTAIGAFTYDQLKGLSGFMSDNLAAMAELLYSRKLNPNEEIINGYGEVNEEKANPIRIIIDKVGIDSIILNPESTDIEVLEGALKYGIVRYPKSGILGEKDNIYLFGHSTSIKVVNNQAYKALNGLNKLEKGDIIKIQSENKEHVYRVTSVTMKKNSDAVVTFNTGKKTLTISTCNTLGAKEDRYIVKADFITSYPLASVTINEEIPTTPVNPVTPTTPATPGTETNTVISMGAPSNPYGKVDLDGKITQVGIIDSETGDFIATTTLSVVNKIAVKFVISNLGTKTAEGWSFNMVLPTTPQYIYHSNSQDNLRPGERIEYAIAFDKPKEGDNAEIILNVDPTRSIYESNEDNNIVKRIIEITNPTTN